jgi:two-component system, cell cycle response regulator DivK
MHILVIEDHAETSLLLRLTLQASYDVSVVRRAEDAIRKLKDESFDLVLVDIDLGEGMNGLDLLEYMRGDEALARIPVVACTAYALPGDEEKFLSAGFTDYIPKPFTRKIFLQAIEKALSNAIPVSQSIPPPVRRA